MDDIKKNKRKLGSILIFVLILTGCVSEPLVKKEKTYAPIEASLYNTNQKVAGHFNESGIPDGFDANQWRAAVEQVCFPNPYCKPQAEGILDSFGIKARKVDDLITVLLCDKELKWKIMEDFSCNNRRVEIETWKLGDHIQCEFEADWQRVVQEYCK